MSTLSDTWTTREVTHEWDLHVRQWEVEHLNDDDVQKLRASTMRGTQTLDRVMAEHYALMERYTDVYDDCDQEEER